MSVKNTIINIFGLPIETVNCAALTVVAVIEAVQFLLALTLISTFIGFPSDFKIFMEFFDTLHPTHAMALYRVFVVTAVALAAAGAWFFRRRLDDPAFTRFLGRYLLADIFIVGLQVYVACKVLFFAWAPWIVHLFYVFLAMGILSKIFIWEIIQWWRQWSVKVPALLLRFRLGADAMMLTVMAAILTVPDVDKVVAHLYTKDNFYHLDTSAMTPALVSYFGGKVSVDITSYYSPAFPVFLAQLGKWEGGLTYHGYMVLIVFITVAYYFLFYFLLRRWIGIGLAALGVFWAIQWQMFHPGLSSLVLQFPSATVLRFCLDVPVYIFLLAHWRTRSPLYLMGAAVLTGISLTHFVDTGLYLLTGFWAYVLAVTVIQYGLAKDKLRRWPWRELAGTLLTPLLTAVFVLWLINGMIVFQEQFWNNVFDQAQMTLKGWLSHPFYESLQANDPWAFAMGVFIPLVYTVVLVWGILRLLLKKAVMEEAFLISMAVYGLSLYHYYVLHATGNCCFELSVFCVALLCRGIAGILRRFSSLNRLLVAGVLAAISVLALFTNNNFILYPNIFSVAAAPWDWEAMKVQQKQQEEAMRPDVDLIKRLTPQGSGVAVFSSFETTFLLDAGRRPLLYYSPLFRSSWLDSNEFKGTLLFTPQMMRKTLDQLEHEKPPIIFVEKKVFYGRLPPQIYQYSYSLQYLMEYIRSRYQPLAEGHYLAALKRI